MDRTEILNSPEYWFETNRVLLANMIFSYLRENNMETKDLSKKSGVWLSKINNAIQGEGDLRLSDVVRLCVACEKKPKIHFEENSF